MRTPSNAEKKQRFKHQGKQEHPQAAPAWVCLGAGGLHLTPAARKRRGPRGVQPSPATTKFCCRLPALAFAGHRLATRRTVPLHPLRLRAQGCLHVRARRAYCWAWPEAGAPPSTSPSSMPGSPRPAARNSGDSEGHDLKQRPHGSGRPPSLGPTGRLPPREPPSPAWPPAPPQQRCRHTAQAKSTGHTAHGAQAAWLHQLTQVAAPLRAGPQPPSPLRPAQLRSTTAGSPSPGPGRHGCWLHLPATAALP